MVSSWTRDPDDRWLGPKGHGSFEDLERAVARLEPLRRVSHQDLTLFSSRDTQLGSHQLAPLLDVEHDRLTSAGSPSPEQTVPASDEDDDYIDELIEEVLGGLEWIPVSCYLNGLRLVPVRVGEEWCNLLFDECEEQFSVQEEMAHYQWFSESGGAPISWDGGASIEVVSPDLLCLRKWGDLNTTRDLVPMPSTDQELVDLIASWLVDDLEASTEAALALEPLDPGNTLTPDQRAQWLDRLDQFTASLWVDLDDSTLQRLRQRLTAEASHYRSEDYAAVAAALSQPLSESGQQLAAALDSANQGGVIADVLYGNWKTD